MPVPTPAYATRQNGSSVFFKECIQKKGMCMKYKEVFWNQFALEDYEERLDGLSAKSAQTTDANVQDILQRIPASVRQRGYHDKDRGIRKFIDKNEVILYKEHDTRIEILGAFHERSDWQATFRS